VNEPCVFLRIRERKILITTLYVDDALIFATDESEKLNVTNNLVSRFEMKDLGKGPKVLGIRIRDEKGVVKLHQVSYAKDVLSRFNMTVCKAGTTPMSTGQGLTNLRKKVIHHQRMFHTKSW
jgi:hypothetical protein